jgi:hypothetical protein
VIKAALQEVAVQAAVPAAARVVVLVVAPAAVLVVAPAAVLVAAREAEETRAMAPKNRGLYF